MDDSFETSSSRIAVGSNLENFENGPSNTLDRTGLTIFGHMSLNFLN